MGRGGRRTLRKKLKSSKRRWRKSARNSFTGTPGLAPPAIAHVSNSTCRSLSSRTPRFSGKEHWPKAITLNDLLISEGKKMSKSKETSSCLTQSRKQSARTCFDCAARTPPSFGAMLDYKEQGRAGGQENFLKYVSAVRELNAVKESKAESEQTSLSNWMVSKFESTLRDSTNALEEYRLRDYIQASFFDLLNSYDYFFKRATSGEKAFVAKKYWESGALLLCPVVPHACEELWRRSAGRLLRRLRSG